MLQRDVARFVTQAQTLRAYKKMRHFSAGRSITFAVSICSNTTLKQTDTERVGRSKLIQTNLTEPDVEFFYELNSLSLVRLMKSSESL